MSDREDILSELMQVIGGKAVASRVRKPPFSKMKKDGNLCWRALWSPGSLEIPSPKPKPASGNMPIWGLAYLSFQLKMGMFVDEHLSCHESADSCILVSDVSPAAGRRNGQFDLYRDSDLTGLLRR